MSAELPAGAQLGSWRIERTLGKGGMGVVYAARDVTLGRAVAIKVVRGDLVADPRFMQRFAREAKAASGVSHPNVAVVHHAGQERGLAFLVLELLPGGSLKDRMRREGRLEWREACRLGAQVARALEAVHAAGMVHRDLKPENVLLDAKGDAKLTDFGIVGRTGDGALSVAGLTKTGELIGTLDYMAPEQADTGRVDARADLYALGGTLYALLTGGPPFSGTGYDLIAKHLKERPRPLPGIPPALDALVQRLLAKDPEDRGDAASVARELEALARTEEARRGASRWLKIAGAFGLAAAAAGLALALAGERPPAPPAPPVVPPKPKVPRRLASKTPRTWMDDAWSYGRTNAVACSPDGRWLAVTDYAHRAWLVDAKTGAAALALRTQGLASGLAFSRDGEHLFLGDYATIRTLAVPSGAVVDRVDLGGLRCTGLAIGHDGSRLVATYSHEKPERGGGIEVFAISGARLTSVRRIDSEACHRPAFEPEGPGFAAFQGTRLVAGDARSGELGDTGRGGREQGNAVAVTADRVVFAPGKERRLKVLERGTWRELGELAGHEGDIKFAARAGDTVLSGDRDGVVIAWDLLRLQPRHVWREHAWVIQAIELVPGTELVVSSGQDGVRFGNLRTGAPERVHPLRAVKAIDVSGGRGCALWMDGTVQRFVLDEAGGVRWEARHRERKGFTVAGAFEAGRLAFVHNVFENSAARESIGYVLDPWGQGGPVPLGEVVAKGQAVTTATLFRGRLACTATGRTDLRVLGVTAESIAPEGLEATAVASAGGALVVGGKDGRVATWDPGASAPRPLAEPLGAAVALVAMRGDVIAAVSVQGELGVWRGGARVRSFTVERFHEASALAVLSNECVAVGVSHDRTDASGRLLLVNVEDGAVEEVGFEHDVPTALALDATGGRLVVGTERSAVLAYPLAE